MSHLNNNNLDQKMAQISINSNNHRPSNDDYRPFIHELFLTNSESQIKSSVAELLKCVKTDDQVRRFVQSLVGAIKSDDAVLKQKIESIKSILNEIDEQSIAMSQTGQIDKSTPSRFARTLEAVVDAYFTEIGDAIDRLMDDTDAATINSELVAIGTALIRLSQLLEVRNWDPLLYPMARLAERLLTKAADNERLQPVAVEFTLHINHRLVNYLAVVPGNPVSKGLKEAISIYSTVRNNIVQLKYANPDIISRALSILEHRSRFFGLTADAIPENENHGDYIVVDPLNTPFEDDDVYDDYEKFLSGLSN